MKFFSRGVCPLVCAYCKQEKGKTREHIISSSVLRLFPDCNYTYDYFRKNIHKKDPFIKDVCPECNNKKLNYIDDYAKLIIEKNFVKSYRVDESLNFEYEYDKLLKAILKYTYNDMRTRKEDVSIFDEQVLTFLLDKDQKQLNKCISLFGGLYVNTSVPEEFFGNQKLQWFNNPTFLDNSIIRYIDYETGHVKPREDLKPMEIRGLNLSYFFRFNSGLFIILFWENSKFQMDYEPLFSLIYPYTLLRHDCNNVKLVRCTHALNCHNLNLIDVSWGLDLLNGIGYTDSQEEID